MSLLGYQLHYEKASLLKDGIDLINEFQYITENKKLNSHLEECSKYIIRLENFLSDIWFNNIDYIKNVFFYYNNEDLLDDFKFSLDDFCYYFREIYEDVKENQSFHEKTNTDLIFLFVNYNYSGYSFIFNLLNELENSKED